MMKKTLTTLLVLLVGTLFLQAENERPLLYPFDVKIGDQVAQMQDGNALFAVIEKPVKANAKLLLEKESPLLIVNAFRCKEDGTVMQAGAQPTVIFAQNTASVLLNATMDKKPLAPGRYLANVVAHNTTSRVVFVVEDPSGKLKIPSIKQVFEYLKK